MFANNLKNLEYFKLFKHCIEHKVIEINFFANKNKVFNNINLYATY